MKKSKLDPKKNIGHPDKDSSKGKKGSGGDKTMMPDDMQGKHGHSHK